MDHTGSLVSGQDYGDWSVVIDFLPGRADQAYTWAGASVQRVALPADSRVAKLGKGDTAIAWVYGPSQPSHLVKINRDGSLGTGPSWPTIPVAPTSLALAPNRVLLAGNPDHGTDNIVWTQPVTPTGFGTMTTVAGRSSAMVATAGRTYLAQTTGVAIYDRGQLGSTLATPNPPTINASGPYLAAWGTPFSEVQMANGYAVADPAAYFEGIFGSRTVSRTWNDTTGTMQITTHDLAGASPDTVVDGPSGQACYGTLLWGDLAAWTCADGILRVVNVTTGAVLATRDGARRESALALGDGYVLLADSTTQVYRLWRLSDDFVVDLTDCRWGVKPATDGVGHVVCASDTELIWRDYSSWSTSTGRVLGWLAPQYFSAGHWAPEVDVTKPFSAGVLRIRKGATVVKEIPVPASADGSLRGVGWDGTTTAGAVAPTGAYTAELVVSATDGTGPVKALDGISAPTLDVAWTGPGLTHDLPGSFVSLTPARLLDTRITSGAMRADSALDLVVTGRGGVPATGVGAVILNVTAVTPHDAGFLTVYPAGSPVPNASNLNFRPGQVVPNLVLAKVGAGGAVTVRNSSPGATHVVVDVAGYVVAGDVVDPGGIVAMAPVRLLETRPALGGAGSVGPDQSTVVQVTGKAGVPTSGVSCVIINLTAVSPATGASGFLSAYPTDQFPAGSSSVNFTRGEAVPNLAFVKLGKAGSLTITNSSWSPTDVLVDVVGYVLDGLPTGYGTYQPVSPHRILDTRFPHYGVGALAADSGTTLTVAGTIGAPTSGMSGVVMNVTSVASAAGYLTVYPADTAVPTASNVNFVAGQTVANLAAVRTNASGEVVIRNSSTSTTDVAVDIAGYFLG